MNKLLTALVAGLFAVSVNAFAADAPKAEAAPAATVEKPAAAPAAKKEHHKKDHHKAEKKADKKEDKKEDAKEGAAK